MHSEKNGTKRLSVCSAVRQGSCGRRRSCCASRTCARCAATCTASRSCATRSSTGAAPSSSRGRTSSLRVCTAQSCEHCVFGSYAVRVIIAQTSSRRSERAARRCGPPSARRAATRPPRTPLSATSSYARTEHCVPAGAINTTVRMGWHGAQVAPQQLLQLIQSCWSEYPALRPDFPHIKSAMRRINRCASDAAFV